MNARRKAWLRGLVLPGLLLCITGGCASFGSDTTAHLSVNEQAEALTQYSLGLLSGNSGDHEAALEHFQQAIRIDPDASTLYTPAIAAALRLKNHEEALHLCEVFRARQPDALQPLLLHADVYELIEQPEQAERLFRESVQSFPEDADALLSLARFLAGRKKYPETITLLKQSPALIETNAEMLTLLGALTINRAHDENDVQDNKDSILEGIALLEQAQELAPDNPQRLQQLGFAYLAAEDSDKATAAFEKSRKLAPGDSMVSNQLLNIYTQKGMVAEALDICDDLMRQTGTDPELWTQYLLNNLPKEKREGLAEYLQQHIDNHADAPLLYYVQLGTLYLNKDNIEKTEAVLKAANKVYFGDSRLEAISGYLLLHKKKFSEAFETFHSLRKTDPDSSWVQTPMFKLSTALAAHASGQIEEAARILNEEDGQLTEYMRLIFMPDSPVSTDDTIDLLQAFQTLRPDAAEPFYFLSLILSERQQYDDALVNAQTFEARAMANGQTNLLGGTVYYQHACLYERTGQLDEAERLFQKAIELGPPVTTASAQNYLAYMWAERGVKLDMGLKLILQALETDPDNAAFIDTLGWVYYKLGEYEKALPELKKAGNMVPDDPTIWQHIGDTYLQLGDLRAAVENWEKAAELAPEDMEILERIKLHPISSTDDRTPVDSPADTPAHP
jgi:tetratricopeptide (TPR) repeat protein